MATVQSSKLNISGYLMVILILVEGQYSDEMLKTLWVFSRDMTAALCVFKWFQDAQSI